MFFVKYYAPLKKKQWITQFDHTKVKEPLPLIYSVLYISIACEIPEWFAYSEPVTLFIRIYLLHQIVCDMFKVHYGLLSLQLFHMICLHLVMVRCSDRPGVRCQPGPGSNFLAGVGGTDYGRARGWGDFGQDLELSPTCWIIVILLQYWKKNQISIQYETWNTFVKNGNFNSSETLIF